jgi:8-oxo-dGTP diphosphatase
MAAPATDALCATLPSGDALCLRRVTPADAPAVAALLNEWDVVRYTSDAIPWPYTPAHAEAYVTGFAASRQHEVWAICVGGGADDQQQLAGVVGLHSVRPAHDGGGAADAATAVLGYWVGRPFWRRGIATAAVRLALAWGWAHLPALQAVTAVVAAPNVASSAVLLRAGFAATGVVPGGASRCGPDGPSGPRQVHDLLTYALTRPPNSGGAAAPAAAAPVVGAAAGPTTG